MKSFDWNSLFRQIHIKRICVRHCFPLSQCVGRKQQMEDRMSFVFVCWLWCTRASHPIVRRFKWHLCIFHTTHQTKRLFTKAQTMCKQDRREQRWQKLYILHVCWWCIHADKHRASAVFIVIIVAWCSVWQKKMKENTRAKRTKKKMYTNNFKWTDNVTVWVSERVKGKWSICPQARTKKQLLMKYQNMNFATGNN